MRLSYGTLSYYVALGDPDATTLMQQWNKVEGEEFGKLQAHYSPEVGFQLVKPKEPQHTATLTDMPVVLTPPVRSRTTTLPDFKFNAAALLSALQQGAPAAIITDKDDDETPA